MPRGGWRARPTPARSRWSSWSRNGCRREIRVSIGDVGTSGEGARVLGRTLARAKAAGPLGNRRDRRPQAGDRTRVVARLRFLALSSPEGRRARDADRRVRRVRSRRAAGARDCSDHGVRPRGRRRRRGTAPGQPGGRAVQRGRTAGAGDGPPGRRSATFRSRAGRDADGARPRHLAAVAETALVQIDSTGADLKLTEVRAEPQLEIGNALAGGASMGCNVRNAARGRLPPRSPRR